MKLGKSFFFLIISLFLGVFLIVNSSSVQYDSEISATEEEVDLEESEIRSFSFSTQNFDDNGGSGKDIGSLSKTSNRVYNGFSKDVIYELPQEVVFTLKDLYILYCNLKIYCC